MARRPPRPTKRFREAIRQTNLGRKALSSEVDEVEQVAWRTLQDLELDKAVHTDEPSTQPRPRRASVSSDERRLRRWKRSLGLVNAYRVRLAGLAATAKRPGRSFLDSIDHVATEALRDWADRPDARPIAPARASTWWLCLVGALIVLAKRGADSADVFSGITAADPINEAADRFLQTWNPPGVWTLLESDPGTQVLGVELVSLLHEHADARDRLRRCQYSPCGRIFFDASPTYRSNPAKGCTRSHKDMATRTRRRSRP